MVRRPVLAWRARATHYCRAFHTIAANPDDDDVNRPFWNLLEPSLLEPSQKRVRVDVTRSILEYVGFTVIMDMTPALPEPAGKCLLRGTPPKPVRRAFASKKRVHVIDFFSAGTTISLPGATDGNVAQLLSNAGGPVLDFSHSTLSAASLPPIVAWLHADATRHVCVQHTRLGFYEMCRYIAMHDGGLDLVTCGRLAFSSASDKAGKELDLVHAKAFEQGREVGLADAYSRLAQSLQAATDANAATADSLRKMQEQRRVEHEEWQAKFSAERADYLQRHT